MAWRLRWVPPDSRLLGAGFLAEDGRRKSEGKGKKKKKKEREREQDLEEWEEEEEMGELQEEAGGQKLVKGGKKGESLK